MNINKYPYTDFHELNLDWFLAQFKALTDAWDDQKADYEQFKTDVTTEFNNLSGKFDTLEETVQTFTTYITNYFDNLDVQEEVNTKLNEMVSDGTMAELIRPIFDAYASQMTQRMNVLEGRMDEFASLPDGSTAGNAELVDIRVAANGTIYPSAGDAVRGQVNEINDQIDDIAQDNIINIPLTWARTDEYINSTGTISSATYYYQSIIEVTPGEEFILTGTNDYSKAIYATLDANGNPVRHPAMGATGTVTNIHITIESGESKLVLQAKAADRSIYKLEQNIGKVLKDGIVDKDNLSQSIIEKLPETEIVNLLDINAEGVTTGNYISRDGTLHEDNVFNVSDYIPIELNTDYVFPVYANFFGDANVIYIPFFDAERNYISFVTGTYDGNTQLVTARFTDPNARYTRINFAKINTYLVNTVNHNPEVMMFTKSPYPDTFIPFGKQSYFEPNVYKNVANEQIANPLFRKNAIFLGDSICNAASANDDKNGWAGRIGNKNEMLWKNFGISGATFTDGLTGSAGVISNQPFDDPMYSGDPDYIIFEGGTNDADKIGNALDTLPAKFGTWTDGDYISDFANTTYCGAIEYMIKKAITARKGAKIGMIIAPKMGQLNATYTDYTPEHNNRRFYFETLIKICKKWGIPVLNLWDDSYLNPMLPAHYTFGEDYMYTDGQHLTSNGYEYITPIIEAWMKTL